MEHYTLFDLIEKTELDTLREKIEKKDEYGFFARAKKAKEALFSDLTEEQKTLAVNYAVAIEDKFDEISFKTDFRLLTRAFRLGMEMQRAFDEEEGG